MLEIQRKIPRHGLSHPIQISMILVENNVEILLKKVLLYSDGRSRKFAIKPGKYILRAREVPIGCNLQGEELFFEVLNDGGHLFVLVRVGNFFQILTSGLGACLLPQDWRFSQRTFYMDQVSQEAFLHETALALKKNPSSHIGARMQSHPESAHHQQHASPRSPHSAPLHQQTNDDNDDEDDGNG